MASSTASPPPPPPPPPPPLPPHMPMGPLDSRLDYSMNCSEANSSINGLDLVSPNGNIKPHMKMRTLNWRRIPKGRVLMGHQALVEGGHKIRTINNNTKTTTTTTSQLVDLDRTPRQRTTFSAADAVTAAAVVGVAADEDGTASRTSSGESDDESTNIWFLIAKANKTIKRIEQQNDQTTTTTTTANSQESETNSEAASGGTPSGPDLGRPVTRASNKSASRIRDMLESVRRRMAAVSAGQTTATADKSQQDHQSPGRASLLSIYSNLDGRPLSSSATKCRPTKLFNTGGGGGQQQKPKSVLEAIDFHDLESLFCLNNQPSLLHSQTDDDHQTAAFVRRSSWRTNASSDSVISSTNSYDSNQHLYDDDYRGDGGHDDTQNDNDDDDSSENEPDDSFELPSENILDSKKSLNVNIFLKQLKNQQELLQLIDQCDHATIGNDKLENLLKLLPNESEQVQLMKFYSRNKHDRLPIAERFLLQMLVRVPNLELKIKFMLLKEKYYTDIDKQIPQELDKIDAAVGEIRHSKKFRDILNLVLVTGNFLNSGGYAADAVGFSLDCLDRLNEVRSNRDGIYLIHYVAEIAHKMQLVEFQRDELQHVESASRVCLESIKLDLVSIIDKINALKEDIDRNVDGDHTQKQSLLATITKRSMTRQTRRSRRGCNSTDKVQQGDLEAVDSVGNVAPNQKEFLLNLLRTLEDIKCNVEFLKKRLTVDLETTRKRLADYLCEDPVTFNLHDCFRSILTFCQRLKVASDENERRQRLEMSKACCGLKRSNTINSRLPKTCNNNSTLAKLGDRKSLGGVVSQQTATSQHQQSYLAKPTYSDKIRASFGGYVSNDRYLQQQKSLQQQQDTLSQQFGDLRLSLASTTAPTAACNLRRTSSNCSSFIKSSMSSLSSQATTSSTAASSISGTSGLGSASGYMIGEHDDLHEGLMRLLNDSNSRRNSDIGRTALSNQTINGLKKRGSFVSHRRKLFGA